MSEHKTPTMEYDEAAWWDSLPRAADSLAGEAESAPAASRNEPGPSRRTIVRGAVAVGAGLALNVLQVFSGVKLKHAGAAVGSEWTGNGCGGYSNSPGYNNNTLVCVGFYYSWWYCGTDGWFKNYWVWGQGFWPVRLCNGRNAWRWSHAPYRYRCADGYYQWYSTSNRRWYGPYPRICSQWIGYA